MRGRGRNPKGYESLITQAYKEGKAKYCRAIMRKLVKLIKKDESIAKRLTQLLQMHGYHKDSFKVVQHSAMESKTMFHDAVREQADYQYAEKALSEMFQNIRYKYSKKCMEAFF